jgi:hypothetical protein
MVVGWFQHSLPGFLSSYQPKHQLVIHIDCDLFSSAMYVLAVLNPLIQSGTIIIFDDFTACLDEYRALMEYASVFLRTYKIIAAQADFSRIAIELD